MFFSMSCICQLPNVRLPFVVSELWTIQYGHCTLCLLETNHLFHLLYHIYLQCYLFCTVSAAVLFSNLYRSGLLTPKLSAIFCYVTFEDYFICCEMKPVLINIQCYLEDFCWRQCNEWSQHGPSSISSKAHSQWNAHCIAWVYSTVVLLVHSSRDVHRHNETTTKGDANNSNVLLVTQLQRHCTYSAISRVLRLCASDRADVLPRPQPNPALTDFALQASLRLVVSIHGIGKWRFGPFRMRFRGIREQSKRP